MKNTRSLAVYVAVAAALLFTLVTCQAQAQTPPANNTQVTVDITKLDSVARDKVLAAVQEQAPAITTSTVGEWAAAGKGVGEAIAAAAKALNTGVNDFIKTPAGILTIWVILGYLFGETLLGLVFGPIIWIILGTVIWYSAKAFLRPNKKVLKDGTVVDNTYQWKSGEAKAICGFAHFASFVLLSIVMLAIIF